MNKKTAIEKIKKYEKMSDPTSEDELSYVQALEFLAESENDHKAYLHLGGFYYAKRQYEHAKKYYELASELKDIEAFTCLGYIWYYGRTGTTDFKKAFEYFNIAADQGEINAMYKIADMYRAGYYVEKDYEKYREIIEALYDRINSNEYEWFHIPEICTRLADIRKHQGNPSEAMELLLKAKDVLEYRLLNNAFFGNVTTMRYLICNLYDIIEFDYDNMDLYDLFWIMREPRTVDFKYNRRPFTVKSVQTEEGMVIRFDNMWYRTLDDFFERAKINGKHITSLKNSLYDFTVTE